MFPLFFHPRHFLRVLLTLLALLGAGPAGAAFTDNGDGTVSDTITGLMWDQCSWGQSGACAGTGNAGNNYGASTHTWQQALGVAATANAMNGGAGYKSHNDWRLPNRAELESLVKIDRFSPAIDATAFPHTVAAWYWTSTIYTPYPAVAWIVGFSNGSTSADYLDYDYLVRLVRSGQSFGSFDSLSAGTTLTPQTITVEAAAESVAVGGDAMAHARATSGLAVVFSSLTTPICTVSGNADGDITTARITGVAAGTCTIAADQAGNATYSAAPRVTRNFAVSAASAPGAPTIASVTPGAGQVTIRFTPPVNTGGSAVVSYTADCVASGRPTRSATGSGSPLTVRNLTGNVAYQCTVTATNGGGVTSGASAAMPVTPTPAKKGSLTPILMLLLD